MSIFILLWKYDDYVFEGWLNFATKLRFGCAATFEKHNIV